MARSIELDGNLIYFIVGLVLRGEGNIACLWCNPHCKTALCPTLPSWFIYSCTPGINTEGGRLIENPFQSSIPVIAHNHRKDSLRHSRAVILNTRNSLVYSENQTIYPYSSLTYYIFKYVPTTWTIHANPSAHRLVERPFGLFICQEPPQFARHKYWISIPAEQTRYINILLDVCPGI